MCSIDSTGAAHVNIKARTAAPPGGTYGGQNHKAESKVEAATRGAAERGGLRRHVPPVGGWGGGAGGGRGGGGEKHLNNCQGCFVRGSFTQKSQFNEVHSNEEVIDLCTHLLTLAL